MHDSEKAIVKSVTNNEEINRFFFFKDEIFSNNLNELNKIITYATSERRNSFSNYEFLKRKCNHQYILYNYYFTSVRVFHTSVS